MSAPKTVVVAEDDPHILTLLRFALQGLACEVQAFTDGALALERLQAGPSPDLVLLDGMLPGLAGLEVLARLRLEPALRALPVVIISARARDADREVALERGATAFVAKPFDVDELCALAERLLKPSEEETQR